MVLSNMQALTVSLIALALCSCGGPKTTNLAPTPTEQTIKKIPAWYLNPPQEDDYLFATSTSTSRDMQVAVQKAKVTAQASLAQQLETNLSDLTKNFQNETGLGSDSELITEFSAATKAVTQQTLNGTRVTQQEILPEKDIYRVYLLMSLPIGAANKQLMEKIKGNQALYTQFRATKAFEELDKEIGKLEQK